VTYVLDTNTLIYFFRREGQVAKRLLVEPPSSIAIPSIVLYELFTGIAKSIAPREREEQLASLLRVVTVLPFGIDEARATARLRATLESRGTSIGALDTLIAGTTIAVRGTLVTRNLREFERCEGLPLENWYD